jgi:synaptic vesicle membrane protein VAT-1
VPKTNVIRMPDDMSFDDAAGLIVNYVTAYQILFRMANLQPNDVVLIHMAAGGVGFAATQLCKTVPGVVVIGTASAGKHDSIRENGVDHPIDYTSTNYTAEIKKIFPDGIDIVLDPLNGENSIKGYELLKPLGRIVHYGAASMTNENRSLISAFKTWWKCLTINSLEIISENKSISGYHLGVLFNNPIVFQKTISDVNTLLNLYKDGKIKIQIDSIYPYSKIGEAMKRMHTRQNVGKIILKPDSEYQETVADQDQVKISTTATTSPIVDTQTLTKEEKKEAKKDAKKEEKKAESKETAKVAPVEDNQIIPESTPSDLATKPVTVVEEDKEPVSA